MLIGESCPLEQVDHEVSTSSSPYRPHALTQASTYISVAILAQVAAVVSFPEAEPLASSVKVVKPAAKGGVRKRPAAAAGVQQSACKRPAAAESQQLPAPSTKPPDMKTELPDWYGEANAESQNQVFLVTAAKLVNEEDQTQNVEDETPPPLRNPSTITKLEFRAALQDAIANPMYEHKRGGRPPTRKLELDVYVGVMEGELGEKHHHAALKLFEGNHRFPCGGRV